MGHPLGLHPVCKNVKQAGGDTSTKDYNCLVENCGMWFTNKELSTAIFRCPTSILASSVFGLGWMVPVHVPIPSKTGKHSGSTRAASIALVLTHPTDVSIQGLIRADLLSMDPHWLWYFHIRISLIMGLIQFQWLVTETDILLSGWKGQLPHTMYFLNFQFIQPTHISGPHCSLQPSKHNYQPILYQHLIL